MTSATCRTFPVIPYNMSVFVFRSMSDLKDFFQGRFGPCYDLSDLPDKGFDAMVVYREHPNTGVSYQCLVLPEDAALDIIVHECSHLVDDILHTRGVPLSADNTEVRAYLLQYIFLSVCNVVGLDAKIEARRLRGPKKKHNK